MSEEKIDLKSALQDPVWTSHKIGDTYTMDGKPDLWKIAYYPIFADGKTNEPYTEPRALVEKPMKGGIDFREVPLRYLTKKIIAFLFFILFGFNAKCQMISDTSLVRKVEDLRIQNYLLSRDFNKLSQNLSIYQERRNIALITFLAGITVQGIGISANKHGSTDGNAWIIGGSGICTAACVLWIDNFKWLTTKDRKIKEY